MNTNTWARIVLLGFGLIILAGCGSGGGGDDDSGSSSSSTSSSAGGGGCDFQELISPSERQQANQCGVQASSQVQAADATLDAAIASCQRGGQDAADEFYSQYEMRARQAEAVIEQLCGGSTDGNAGGSSPDDPDGGTPGFEDESDRTFYNLCTATLAVDGGVRVATICPGPFQRSNTQCPSDPEFDFSFMENFESKAACEAAADDFRFNF